MSALTFADRTSHLHQSHGKKVFPQHVDFYRRWLGLGEIVMAMAVPERTVYKSDSNSHACTVFLPQAE